MEKLKSIDLVSYVCCGNPRTTLGNIANIPMVGKRKIVLRFRANQTGPVASFHTWWRYRQANYVNEPGHFSYSAGDGGRYEVTLQGDINNRPDGKPICTAIFEPDIPNFPFDGPRGANNQFRPLPLTQDATVENGRFYNFVFRNIAKDPVANYIGLDGVYDWDKQHPYRGQPLHHNLNQINEISTNGVFKKCYGSMVYYPQWCLRLTNGQSLGQPYQYGSAWTGRHTIGGDQHVVQQLVPRSDAPLDSVYFYATRVKGNKPLVLKISESQRPIEQIEIAADFVSPMTDTPGGLDDYHSFDWIRIKPELQTLKKDAVYSFEFSSHPDSEYFIPGSVRAGQYTGIDTKNLTTRGNALYSVDGGASWDGWLVENTHTLTVDLSLFTLGRV